MHIDSQLMKIKTNEDGSIEVETGRRQLINLWRRAAEMLDNWSRVSAAEDLICDVIFRRLRNETEADNEILRTLRASWEKAQQMSNILHNYSTIVRD